MAQERIEIDYGSIVSGGFPSYDTHNIAPYKDRATPTNGGYFIKDGVCHMDMTFKVLSTTSGEDWGVLQNLPKPKIVNIVKASVYNANNNTFHGTKEIYYDSVNVPSTCLNGIYTANVNYRVLAMYFTDEADTV